MKRSGGRDLYLEVARVVGETLREAGLKPSITIRLTIALTASMCRDFAGSMVYFPKKTAEQHLRKAAAIVSEFDGSNYRELAIKHDLTEASVRNILRRAKNPHYQKTEGEQ